MKKLVILAIAFVLSICTPYYDARAATCPVITQAQTQEVQDAVKDAMRVQNLSDRPQTMTVPVSDGVVTVEPQRIATLPNGDVGLSHATVHTTLITQMLPTPAPIPEKQDVRTLFTVQGVDDIEIKGILPEALDENGLTAVQGMVQAGQFVAGQRLSLEQYQIQSEAELKKWGQLKSLLLWSLVLLIPGAPVFVKCLNAFRRESSQIEQARQLASLEIERKLDALLHKEDKA